jgi:hypothetical protein
MLQRRFDELLLFDELTTGSFEMTEQKEPGPTKANEVVV